MTAMATIAFIAWILYCVSKAPNTDEGRVAGFFTAVFTFAAWGAIGFGVLLLLVGIFA